MCDVVVEIRDNAILPVIEILVRSCNLLFVIPKLIISDDLSVGLVLSYLVSFFVSKVIC